MKEDAFNKLILNKIEENDIKEEHFAKINQKHCIYIYIYSIYGGNNTIASILLLELLKNIILSNGNCKKIGGLCATQDGVNLAFNMGLKNQVTEKNGNKIKIYGIHANWATFSGEIIDLIEVIGTDIFSNIQNLFTEQ